VINSHLHVIRAGLRTSARGDLGGKPKEPHELIRNNDEDQQDSDWKSVEGHE
jgi:predicted amidohydrolase YtcJ